MRIVFMGSPEFAVPSLKQIIQSKHTIEAVITGEDKRRGRGNTLTPTPVKETALENGLPVYSFEKMKDPELHTLLKKIEPDLIVIVAFKILPKSILEIPKVGSVNIHASLLPKYRGAAPIHWAVVNGEAETGVSIFYLNEEIDAGNIILQEKLIIGDHETTGDVYEKLMILGANSITKALGMIESNSIIPIPQKNELACPAPKVFPEDAHIHFNNPAQAVHNRIRGMNPSPGSWILLDGKKLKLKECCFNNIQSPGIGQLFTENGSLYIGCNDFCIEVKRVQLEGKSEIDGFSFKNGYRERGLIS
jgi:methionyl-tRNA formyltransferase